MRYVIVGYIKYYLKAGDVAPVVSRTVLSISTPKTCKICQHKTNKIDRLICRDLGLGIGWANAPLCRECGMVVFNLHLAWIYETTGVSGIRKYE